jgi:hypothetical protein
MASRRAYAHLAQLWQLPLLVLSLGLFGYAAYLFIDPQPGPSVEQRIAGARAFLSQERPDAGNALLNQILTSDKLTPEQQARVHLMLAESIEMAQKQRRIAVPANYSRIIEQTRLAVGRGAQLDAEAGEDLGLGLADRDGEGPLPDPERVELLARGDQLAADDEFLARDLLDEPLAVEHIGLLVLPLLVPEEELLEEDRELLAGARLVGVRPRSRPWIQEVQLADPDLAVAHQG